jgi:hypothetical protein
MTSARDVTKKLKAFMELNGFDHSDIYRGMISIINPGKGPVNQPGPEMRRGKGRVEARKPVLSQPRKPNPQRSMNKGVEEAEHCFS